MNEKCNLYWKLYLQSRNYRKRKSLLRKLFDCYENVNDFVEYTVKCPYTHFYTINSAAITYPKLKNILFFNQLALYKNQQLQITHIYFKYIENKINDNNGK